MQHSLQRSSRYYTMTQANQKQDWLLLVHQLPPKPTNLRVRIWRKLQKLGAVAIQNSIYVLPFNEKTFEDFQWLKQEIESAGGEVTVFRAGAVEGRPMKRLLKLSGKPVMRNAHSLQQSSTA
jgi:hypothetical protein